MSDTPVVVLASVLGALGGLGGIATLVQAPITRHKIAAEAERNRADAVNLLTGAAASAAQQLADLRHQLSEAESKTRTLITQLDQANARATAAEAEAARLRDELSARRRVHRRTDEGA